MQCEELVQNCHAKPISSSFLIDGADGCKPSVDSCDCEDAYFGVYKLRKIEFTLAKFSLAILFLFLLENLLLIAALKRDFFKNFWHVLDLVVVVASIVFELIYKTHPEGWLLIMAR